MNNLPDELVLNQIINTNLGNIQGLCATNKRYRDICKQNKEYIIKSILKKYDVKYNDPGNLIYTGRNKLKFSDTPDLQQIFKEYLYWYNKTDVFVENRRVTSVPILPKMTRFIGYLNPINYFPTQPNMVYFDCRSCNLMSLSFQPKLSVFYGPQEINPLKGSTSGLARFPIEPKMW